MQFQHQLHQLQRTPVNLHPADRILNAKLLTVSHLVAVSKISFCHPLTVDLNVPVILTVRVRWLASICAAEIRA